MTKLWNESFFATGEREQEIGNKSKTRSNVVSFLFSEGYIITVSKCIKIKAADSVTIITVPFM